MVKKKKKSKKQKKKESKELEEKEESEEEKADDSKEKSDKSELEQEIEEQETPSISKFKQLVEIKPKAPVLELIREEPETPISLEKGMESVSISEKKESERKYDETALKYDIESEYQESLKRQREITPESISQVSPISSIDLEQAGRERIVPQEFKIRAPAEMPSAPPSSEEYNVIRKKAGKFKGDSTEFEKQLERRYDFK